MAFVVGTHGEFKRRDDEFDPAVGPPRGGKLVHASTPPRALNKKLFGGAPPARGKTALSVEQGLTIKLAACATDVSRTGAIGLFDRTLRHSAAKGVLAAQVYMYREIAHACIVRTARAARASVKRHRQEVLGV